MKIQVLELPTEFLGEASHTPFALILSSVPEDELDDVIESVADVDPDQPGNPVWAYVTTLEVEL
jgi:hypothetical protein